MPHIIVKLLPGRTQTQKRALADAITQDAVRTLDIGADSISVAFEEVSQDRWRDDVYVPDIGGQPDRLYKKPGYQM